MKIQLDKVLAKIICDKLREKSGPDSIDNSYVKVNDDLTYCVIDGSFNMLEIAQEIVKELEIK